MELLYTFYTIIKYTDNYLDLIQSMLFTVKMYQTDNMSNSSNRNNPEI